MPSRSAELARLFPQRQGHAITKQSSLFREGILWQKKRLADVLEKEARSNVSCGNTKRRGKLVFTEFLLWKGFISDFTA